MSTPAPTLRTALATAEATTAFGAALAGVLRAGDLVVLTGDLGAGKTTLTRGLGAALGVRGDVTSPTFVIARVHPSTVGGPALVHVDAYRLGSFAEVEDLDLEASLEQSVTVVEWGEGLVEGLWPSWLSVRLERPHGPAPTDADDDGDEPRAVVVEAHGPRWDGVELARLAPEAAR